MFLTSHPDLVICENFISHDEETQLMQNIIEYGSGYVCNEKYGRENILRFGKFKPTIQNVISTTIPSFVSSLSKRLIEQNLISFQPEAISINEYLPLQGIEPHVDSKSSGEVITILSLGSHTVMDFIHNKKKSFSILFPARCVLQIKNELRHEWQHSIQPRSYDVINGERFERKKRYSIVFRQALI